MIIIIIKSLNKRKESQRKGTGLSSLKGLSSSKSLSSSKDKINCYSCGYSVPGVLVKQTQYAMHWMLITGYLVGSVIQRLNNGLGPGRQRFCVLLYPEILLVSCSKQHSVFFIFAISVDKGANERVIGQTRS